MSNNNVNNRGPPLEVNSITITKIMFTDPIKYSSAKQIKEFLDLLSSEELNNLRNYIEGRTNVCDNPQVKEWADDVCSITNYVGGTINIKRDDLRKYLETYIKV